MASPLPTKPKSKAEQEAQQKAARRAEQANILAGARPLLEQDEQLLAFARARVAGGWRSKLNVGPEAFFAPFVNVALTERRFLVQHVHHTNGKPSEMLPHAYAFDKVARVQFTDIETYGGEPACRLILHLENGLYVRLRLRGLLNFESAKSMAKLFDSLTTAKRATPLAPTRSLCPQCDHVLDQPYKFCPYCGTQQPPRTSSSADANAPTANHAGITLATSEVEEKRSGGVEETGSGGEGVQYSIPPTASIFVPRETDFAYEREDRPAEFGFALPVSFSEPFEAEISEEIPAAETRDVETGAARETNASDNASSNADGITAAVTFAPVAAETSEETPAMETLLEPMGDDMFAPDEPVQAHDATDGGGVAFEQYDTQAFTELPFSDTPDMETGGLPGPGFEVAEDDTDVVRDDETEAFLPHTHTDTSGAPSAPHAHDAFVSENGGATGDDNIDLNKPTAEGEEGKGKREKTEEETATNQNPEAKNEEPKEAE